MSDPTSSDDENSMAVADENNDWSLAIGLNVINFMCSCFLVFSINHFWSITRIINANELVRAGVIDSKKGHNGGPHGNDTPPKMLLSYRYKEKYYTVWKENHNNYNFDFGTTERRRSTSHDKNRCVLHVYVDPFNPKNCVVRSQKLDERYIGKMMCLLLNYVSIAVMYQIFAINLMSFTTTEAKIRAWILYGVVSSCPGIILLCCKCYQSYECMYSKQKSYSDSLQQVQEDDEENDENNTVAVDGIEMTIKDRLMCEEVSTVSSSANRTVDTDTGTPPTRSGNKVNFSSSCVAPLIPKRNDDIAAAAGTISQ